MPRAKTVADEEVFAAVRGVLAEAGPRGATFAAVARASGLSAPSLVQRYGDRQGMLRAALSAGWDRLEARTASALAAAGPGTKGAAQLLKLLATGGEPRELSILASDLGDPALRRRAADWRARVEAALAERLGGGRKAAAEAAAILFLAWQGRLVWEGAGGPGFRLRRAADRLAAPGAAAEVAPVPGEDRPRARGRDQDRAT